MWNRPTGDTTWSLQLRNKNGAISSTFLGGVGKSCVPLSKGQKVTGCLRSRLSGKSDEPAKVTAMRRSRGVS